MMRVARSWIRAATLFCLVVSGAAATTLSDPEMYICDLPTSDDGTEFHIRARFVPHAHHVALADPACPDRSLHIRNYGVVATFFEKFDPDGKRFGIPPGAGTYAEIELHGRYGESKGSFVVSSVDGYDKYTVIDASVRIDSTERVGMSNWLVDEQFPFMPNLRAVKEFGNYTVVHGKLGNEDVGKLLKLVNADSSTMCQTSESAQSLVRVQCVWQMGRPRDMRSSVFAREGKSWRLIAHSDGVRL
jgi:hypothetical protein